MSAPRYPWWLEPAAIAGATLIRLLAMTWRIEDARPPEYVAALASGERFVYAFWHSRILPLTWARHGEGITVLVSRHRDGQLITRIIEHLGYTVARGSSTRGGDAGVRELLAMAEAGRDLAITPDGPRGPALRLKEGLPYVASRLERRVVLIACASSKSWFLKSWDRFCVPYPFARLRVAYTAPQAVPGADEPSRLRLERALVELNAANEHALGAGT